MSGGYAEKGPVPLHALHAAVQAADADVASCQVRALLLARADVHSEDAEAETALFKAVGLEQPEMAELLLGAQADVNWRGSEFSFTALHQAACLNNSRMIELLLRARADADIADESGSTPLSLATSVRHRLDSELEDADGGTVCIRELERQALMRDLEQNSEIQDLLAAKALPGSV
ncbi:unnamed protein product [Effrenium voratum]|nr:unnamed protein product [Effrenium voratum]